MLFIFKVVIKWIILSAAVIFASQIIPGIAIASWSAALFVGLILGLINTFIKPTLSILAIPINILTLGLFGFVLNAVLFWAAVHIASGSNPTLLAAFLGSVLVSVVMWLAHFFID